MSRLSLRCFLVISAAVGCASPVSTPSAPTDAVAVSAEELIAPKDPVEADVPALADACPSARADELCSALRAIDDADDRAELERQMERAADAVAARVAREPRSEMITDLAVQLWLRDRAHSLLVQNAFNERRGPQQSWEAFWPEFVARYFPLYEAKDFPLLGAYVSPPGAEICERPRAAIVVFPGVIRTGPRQEFRSQIQTLRNAFPCMHTVRVESDTFASLAANAADAVETIRAIDAEHGPLPLHFVGYSQGSSNALYVLATHPEIRARTRTMMSLNAAAHGSEAADAAIAALDQSEKSKQGCQPLPEFMRPMCERIAASSLAPVSDLLTKIFEGLGATFSDIETMTVADFLVARYRGLASLTTEETARFWREHGEALSTETLYYSFRSTITDVFENLPPSWYLTYGIVAASSKEAPSNDMQVRLDHQHFGGPLTDVEVISHVAEGNHWQWELSSNDVSESMMPAAMLDHVPRDAMMLAYFQTLAEAGLL